MGMYSYFTYEILEGKENFNEEDFLFEVKVASKYDYPFQEHNTWYDCEDHMVEVSKKFPELLIKVKREGKEDDNEDIEEMFFQNGKHYTQQAIVMFLPYNDKLMR